jgi:heme oxygenase (biliverdin-IX-beta and delta-forming)
MAVFLDPDPACQDQAPSARQAPASTSILTRLRLETRGEHDAVEGVLNLMGTSLTRDVYRQRLAQFYGFYDPLEAALQTDSVLGFATLTPRLNKTIRLRQDLQHFGVTADDLPLCSDLPPLRTQAEVLGCMYVLEGATLGGRMISAHIQATLGITPTTGGSFFEGYGGGTAQMWQGMRQMLVEGAPDLHSENAIVTNAIATFAALRGWCQSAQKQTTTDKKRDDAACLIT